MTRLLAAIALCLSLPAQTANTWGTDASDLWWNPTESGWGVNIAHQREVLFITMFVYGVDGRARWYVGPDMRSTGGSFSFTGTLYETTGPYLGGPFNPSAVTNRMVGSAIVNIDTVNTGRIAYVVDGVSVSKNIERQTFRNASLSGTYVGAVIGQVSGCTSQSYEEAALVTVSHSGSAITIVATSTDGSSCTYSGTYSQAGRMGSIQAARSCSDGSGGSVLVYEIEAGYIGFLARYQASYGSPLGTCQDNGKIGGMKR